MSAAGVASPGTGVQKPAVRPLWQVRLASSWLPLLTLAFILLGALFRVNNSTSLVAPIAWWIGLVIVGAPVVANTIGEVSSGRFAVDLVASLAILLALILWEPLAGLVIVLMQTGGEALERYAGRKASDAVRELEEAAPRIAHRITGSEIVDAAAEDVSVGDLLLIRPGELIPCDGIVISGRSHVDVAKARFEWRLWRPRAKASMPGLSSSSDRPRPARHPSSASPISTACGSLHSPSLSA
jgi:cation transport ATPase